MKAVRFDHLIASVVSDLPGCDSGILLRTFREVAREFCRRSQCWREEIAVNLVASTKTYTVTSSFDADIRRIVQVWIRTAVDVTNGDKGQTQELSRIQFSPPGTLTLPEYATSAVTGGLLVKAVLTPSFNSNEIGSEIVELWNHVIEAGVIGKLKGQSGKPWSDPQGARDWLLKFDNGVVQADVDTEKNFTGVEQRAATQNWLV